jgi:hypothetical protein
VPSGKSSFDQRCSMLIYCQAKPRDSKSCLHSRAAMEPVRRKPSHSSCLTIRPETVGACRPLRSRSDGRAGRLTISLIILHANSFSGHASTTRQEIRKSEPRGKELVTFLKNAYSAVTTHEEHEHRMGTQRQKPCILCTYTM